MGRTLLIAISLLRIRRLFFALILIPLLLSLLVVAVQVLASTMIIRIAERHEGKDSVVQEEHSAIDVLRSIALGRSEPFPAPRICRWVMQEDQDGPYEAPPDDACAPDRLDAAIQVKNPADYDPSEYTRILSGNVERIHLCQTCTPDLRFSTENNQRRVEIRSVWSALLTGLLSQNSEVTEAFTRLRSSNDQLNTIIGKKYFIAPGFRRPINLSDIQSTLLFVFNMASLIVVSLWLALKAHRRVLDYFSRNGALLPMVAANGKESFYGALWTITLLRVAAFLLSAVPLMLLSLHEHILDSAAQELLGENIPLTLLWSCALITSLALATLIASIADLRHRSNMMVFSYRFLPLLLALAGAAIWCSSFIFEGQLAPTIRDTVSALPVVGMMPVFISLIFQPQMMSLMIHSLLSIAFIVYLMNMNARWFGAHLEEI